MEPAYGRNPKIDKQYKSRKNFVIQESAAAASGEAIGRGASIQCDALPLLGIEFKAGPQGLPQAGNDYAELQTGSPHIST